MSKVSIPQEQVQKVNSFFDKVIEETKLKNDAALSRALGVAPPVVSKTRAGVLGMTPMMLLRFHDAFNVSVAAMRAELGLSPLVSGHAVM